ncbi:MAG: hypothetical protein JSV91_10815 [Phycisphaerales bacterium]|nr:MAG: hypothetical protein JSV91_10815 [Phycisphaerales bacterium]
MLSLSEIVLLVIGLVVCLALIASAIAVHLLLDVRRSRRIARLGAELGFVYRRRDPRMPPVEIAGLPMFRRRKGRVRGFTRDVLLGVWTGRRIIVFEYDSLAGHGGHSPQTVAAIQLDGADLPAFALWPRNLATRIVGWRRRGDMAVELTQWRELGEKYELHTNDQKRVEEVFAPDICEGLTRIDDWCVEGVGEWLLVYRHHIRCKPADLRSFLGTVEAIADIIAPSANARQL